MVPLKTASASPTGMRATVEELVGRWKDQWRQREDRTFLKGDPEPKPGIGCHPRLGIGLAMCNIFARSASLQIYFNSEKNTDCRRYFGGSLELVSMDGWGEVVQPGASICSTLTSMLIGTDVYLRLPKLVGCAVNATCVLLVDETTGY